MQNAARKLDLPEEVYKQVTQSKEPIVVSKEGYDDVVIMSEKVYEKLEEKLSFLEAKNKILDGQEALKNGEVRPFRAGMAEFAAKEGFPLNA